MCEKKMKEKPIVKYLSHSNRVTSLFFSKEEQRSNANKNLNNYKEEMTTRNKKNNTKTK